MTPEKFLSHNVFEKLEQLKQFLQDEKSKEKLEIESFQYFDSFHTFVTGYLKSTIPSLVQESELIHLASEIEAGNVQLNTFIGNNNAGHLTNAVNNFNSALNRVRNLPIPILSDGFDFSKYATNFENTVSNAYKNLETLNRKLQDDLKSVQDDLNSKNSQITTLQQQLTAKESEIKNVLSNYNSEFERIKLDHESVFESERKKFNDNIDADRKLFKEEFDTAIEDNEKIFEEQKTEIEDQSKKIVDDLNTKLKEAKEIVNIVGNVGVTGNYQNIANQHKNSANFFRWVALGFMVVMSALLIWSIIELSSGEFNLYKSLVRILAAAVLTYPAVYASRESNKHRKLETQNRNLELELASIGPFIELLPESKKQEIKETLVSKYFGNHALADNTKDEEDISINGLEKILKTILPFLKK